MGIAILLVKADISTIIEILSSIEINHDFYTLRNTAEEEGCVFISTIDEAGDTVINRLQLNILQEEIRNLRKRTGVNQSILDKLEQAAIEAVRVDGQYIKFMGE